MQNVMKKKIRIWLLIVSLAIPLLIGGLSAYLTAEDMKIYDTLDNLVLAPPGWVFPIVWTILYLLMGVAAYLVSVSDQSSEVKRKALLFYAAQLVMNFFWSTLFFTYERYLIALIWLMIMWGLILVCMIRFYRIRHAAGIMMGVLLLWTSFAAYLNLSCYILSIMPVPTLVCSFI